GGGRRRRREARRHGAAAEAKPGRHAAPGGGQRVPLAFFAGPGAGAAGGSEAGSSAGFAGGAGASFAASGAARRSTVTVRYFPWLSRVSGTFSPMAWERIASASDSGEVTGVPSTARMRSLVDLSPPLRCASSA